MVAQYRLQSSYIYKVDKNNVFKKVDRMPSFKYLLVTWETSRKKLPKIVFYLSLFE